MNETPRSLEEVYDSYKRVYPWYRGPKRFIRFLGWLDADELRISLVAFFLASIIILFLDAQSSIDPKDILVEAHGLLLDLLLFGVLFLWINQRRSKRERIRSYHETLYDLQELDSKAGVLRKVGIINRLLDIDGPKALPWLDHMELPSANFQGVYMPGVSLGFSNLSNAFLNGTYLVNADLTGTVLVGAYLGWAVLERADLRGADLRGANLEGCFFQAKRGSPANFVNLA